jgi:glycosyltransferase involved in cell wall biosynthesis
VSYIHEVLGPIWNSFYPWPISSLGRLQERWTHWAYRNVQFWTASQCTKDILHSHGIKSVKLIPYGVNTVALSKLDDKPLDRPLRLAVVSRLAPNKRIDHAIRTVKCLAETNVPVRLTIVGEGETRAALQALTAELRLDNQVAFAGSLSEEEKDARLRNSHFLLHTSQREGWGLNVIEANAMGTPAAVYPVAGLIESTLHDQTGIVSEKETPESLASGLMKILKLPERYQAYRVAALERARTFHWSHVLSESSAWLEAQAASQSRPKQGGGGASATN